jgi:hypothetical protein
MTEYDRRAGLPSASYAQFCLELIAFVASHPALRDESRNEQLLAWMDDAAAAERRGESVYLNSPDSAALPLHQMRQLTH